jgi:hypothetical protein
VCFILHMVWFNNVWRSCAFLTPLLFETETSANTPATRDLNPGSWDLRCLFCHHRRVGAEEIALLCNNSSWTGQASPGQYDVSIYLWTSSRTGDDSDDSGAGEAPMAPALRTAMSDVPDSWKPRFVCVGVGSYMAND